MSHCDECGTYDGKAHFTRCEKCERVVQQSRAQGRREAFDEALNRWRRGWVSLFEEWLEAKARGEKA